MKNSSARVATMAMLLFALTLPQAAYAQGQTNTSGKLTLLRVHTLDSGFGPASDSIDAEVIIKLSSEAGRAFGFKLTTGDQGPVHRAMFDLLRDAFRNDWRVSIDYFNSSDPTDKHFLINRVWLSR